MSSVPIYEFICRACDHEFETIVMGSRPPECPVCASTELEKQLSAFAVSTDSRSFEAAPAPCGRCGDPRGAGSCAIN